MASITELKAVKVYGCEWQKLETSVYVCPSFGIIPIISYLRIYFELHSEMLVKRVLHDFHHTLQCLLCILLGTLQDDFIVHLQLEREAKLS